MSPAIHHFLEAASPYLVLWSGVFTVLTSIRLWQRVRHGVDRRYYIEQGRELGAYIFDRLYRHLHAKGAALASGRP